MDFVYFLGHGFLQKILVLLGCLSDSILAEMYVCIHFVCTYMYAAELYVYVPYYVNDINAGTLELVSKELNHLAAILHVYAGGLNFMK